MTKSEFMIYKNIYPETRYFMHVRRLRERSSLSLSLEGELGRSKWFYYKQVDNRALWWSWREVKSIFPCRRVNSSYPTDSYLKSLKFRRFSLIVADCEYGAWVWSLQAKYAACRLFWNRESGNHKLTLQNRQRIDMINWVYEYATVKGMHYQQYSSLTSEICSTGNHLWWRFSILCCGWS